MKEPTVILSKKFGVNPTLTFCPHCGKDTPEILLVGDAQQYECTSCHKFIVGKRPKECPFCQSSLIVHVGPFDGTRNKLPAHDLCEDCKKLAIALTEEVEKGGVRWKCQDCKAEGVIKHGAPAAIRFKEEYPDKKGLMLSEASCPVCRKEME